MPYTVHTVNEPDVAKEVDDAEFIDLSRLGLIVPNKGDVNKNGQLKQNVDAPDETKNVTGAQPVLTQNGGQ